MKTKGQAVFSGRFSNNNQEDTSVIAAVSSVRRVKQVATCLFPPKFVAATASILLFSAVVGALGGTPFLKTPASPESAYASVSQTVNIDVKNSLTMTLSDTAVTVSVDPTVNSGFASASSTVTVSTNSTNGYSLWYKSSATSLAGSAHSENSLATLSSATSTFSSDDAAVNKWGISAVKGSSVSSTYNPASTTYQNLDVTSALTTNQAYTFSVGARVDMTTPADTYSGTIVIAAVTNNNQGEETGLGSLESAFAAHNAKTAKFADGKTYYTIQQENMKDICDSIKIDTETDGMQVIDERDGKLYWIAKLADGKCWMTQNLDLDLTTGSSVAIATYKDKTYGSSTWTPEDSVRNTQSNSSVSDWSTNASAISGTTLKTYRNNLNATQDGTTVNNGWINTYYHPESIDPGDYYMAGGTSNTALSYGSTVDSSKEALTQAEAAGDTNLHYHRGNLYNWTAATAMNDSSTYTSNHTNVETSICPTGWRLPQSDSDGSSANTGDFEELMEALGYDKSSLTFNGTYGYWNQSWSKAILAPAYLAASGLTGWNGSALTDGAFTFLGTESNYWSSAVNSASSARRLIMASGLVYPAGTGNRFYGNSVRCVSD